LPMYSGQQVQVVDKEYGAFSMRGKPSDRLTEIQQYVGVARMELLGMEAELARFIPAKYLGNIRAERCLFDFVR